MYMFMLKHRAVKHRVCLTSFERTVTTYNFNTVYESTAKRTKSLARFRMQSENHKLLHGNASQPCINVTSADVCMKQRCSIFHDCTSQQVTNSCFFNVTVYNPQLCTCLCVMSFKNIVFS